MKIEAGKYYRTRDGEVVFGPVRKNTDSSSFANGYLWESGSIRVYYWKSNGRYIGNGTLHDFDLVEEVVVRPALVSSPPYMTHSTAVEPGDVAGDVAGEAVATVRVSPTGGVKASIGKRPLHLLPRDALEAVADALEHGARRYGDRNWEKGLSVSDLVRAADGHLWDWYLRRDDGKDAGPGGSGLSHLAHAACCILFLLSHELRGLPDDRPAPVPAVPRPTHD